MARGDPTILQIIPRLDTGGAELSTIEIADAVTRAGGRALVLSEGGRLTSRLASAGGELIAFPAATKNPWRILANAHAIVRLIEREQVALIHARSRAPAWSALIAARRTGIPFVTTYHGAYAESGRLKRLYNSVMARADSVIANSQYTARLIHDRYGTPPERVRVIHRGVDVEAFRPEAVAAERVQALRRAWGLSGDEPVVLQAARLTAWKGQRVLIEAAGRLAADGRLGNAVVVLAGDAQGRDGYQASLADLARRQGIAERIRLVGHVDDIAAAYRAAHVTVVASIEPEAFGRAATEAQAMGSPVIATDIGAPPETVLAEPGTPLDGITGWLVPPDDAAAMASRLAIALGLSTHAREALGRRAHAHVAHNFTLNVMKRQTLGVYDRLLGNTLAARFDSARLSTPAS